MGLRTSERGDVRDEFGFRKRSKAGGGGKDAGGRNGRGRGWKRDGKIGGGAEVGKVRHVLRMTSNDDDDVDDDGMIEDWDLKLVKKKGRGGRLKLYQG